MEHLFQVKVCLGASETQHPEHCILSQYKGKSPMLLSPSINCKMCLTISQLLSSSLWSSGDVSHSFEEQSVGERITQVILIFFLLLLFSYIYSKMNINISLIVARNIINLWRYQKTVFTQTIKKWHEENTSQDLSKWIRKLWSIMFFFL